MRIRISVIIPVFNTSLYLSKCLESVINQTLTDIEIIIVNDGSTDNSQEIIEHYKKKDNRIVSIIKENGGLSDARNAGIEIARGEYFSFIDSDDYIDLLMLEKMYNIALVDDSDIVFCDLMKVDENGQEFRQIPQSPQLPKKILLENNLIVFGEMSCFACNKIFKRVLFNKHRFKKDIQFEDVELVPKLVLDSTVLSKLNEPLYKYFERKNSITKTHNERGLDMFIALEEVIKYFDKSYYKENRKELERFQIIQGYYSYLAYVAYVRDKKLKKKMLYELKTFLLRNNLKKRQIFNYQRFGLNYLKSLPLKKKMFYILSYLNLDLLSKF